MANHLVYDPEAESLLIYDVDPLLNWLVYIVSSESVAICARVFIGKSILVSVDFVEPSIVVNYVSGSAVGANVGDIQNTFNTTQIATVTTVIVEDISNAC